MVYLPVVTGCYYASPYCPCPLSQFIWDHEAFLRNRTKPVSSSFPGFNILFFVLRYKGQLYFFVLFFFTFLLYILHTITEFWSLHLHLLIFISSLQVVDDPPVGPTSVYIIVVCIGDLRWGRKSQIWNFQCHI